jgi:quinol monooxygenase YgiN
VYARVMAVQIEPHRLDDAARAWRTLILPDHRRRTGFRRASMVADRASGTVLMITYWDSRADSDAEERDPSRAAMTGQVRLFFDGPAVVRGYEVLAEEPAS